MLEDVYIHTHTHILDEVSIDQNLDNVIRTLNESLSTADR